MGDNMKLWDFTGLDFLIHILKFIIQKAMMNSTEAEASPRERKDSSDRTGRLTLQSSCCLCQPHAEPALTRRQRCRSKPGCSGWALEKAPWRHPGPATSARGSGLPVAPGRQWGGRESVTNKAPCVLDSTGGQGPRGVRTFLTVSLPSGILPFSGGSNRKSQDCL